MRSQHPELARPPKRCLLLFGHPCRLFLGPGFRLVARWNRLGEAVQTHKTREKTEKKWARYGLKRVNKRGERRDHLDPPPLRVPERLTTVRCFAKVHPVRARVSVPLPLVELVQPAQKQIDITAPVQQLPKVQAKECGGVAAAYSPSFFSLLPVTHSVFLEPSQMKADSPLGKVKVSGVITATPGSSSVPL